jgi:hypothetical protein
MDRGEEELGPSRHPIGRPIQREDKDLPPRRPEHVDMGLLRRPQPHIEESLRWQHMKDTPPRRPPVDGQPLLMNEREIQQLRHSQTNLNHRGSLEAERRRMESEQKPQNIVTERERPMEKRPMHPDEKNMWTDMYEKHLDLERRPATHPDQRPMDNNGPRNPAPRARGNPFADAFAGRPPPPRKNPQAQEQFVHDEHTSQTQIVLELEDSSLVVGVCLQKRLQMDFL